MKAKRTRICAAAAMLSLAAASAASAQWMTPIQDWPAQYTGGPFEFVVKGDVEALESGENECLPAMRGLSEAAYEEMERHELAKANTWEEARIFFRAEMLAAKTGSRCTVFMRPSIVTEIQVEQAGVVTIGIGRADMSGIMGTKLDAERWAQETIRAFIADAGRGILAARLRQALQATGGSR